MNQALRAAAALFALALAGPAAAGAGFVPQAGTHYRAVEPPVPTAAPPGQVEVIEFVSLGCPACAALEPHLQSWLRRKPPAVAFRRVPATFNPVFKALAKVQLALEDVGAADRVMPLAFSALHTARDPRLAGPIAELQQALQRNGDAIAAERRVLEAYTAFAARHGVDARRFEAALRSPSVAVRLAQADALFKRYRATGIPALAIDGRWFTQSTRPFAFDSYEQYLGTVDHLARAAAAR